MYRYIVRFGGSGSLNLHFFSHERLHPGCGGVDSGDSRPNDQPTHRFVTLNILKDDGLGEGIPWRNTRFNPSKPNILNPKMEVFFKDVFPFPKMWIFGFQPFGFWGLPAFWVIRFQVFGLMFSSFSARFLASNLRSWTGFKKQEVARCSHFKWVFPKIGVPPTHPF